MSSDILFMLGGYGVRISDVIASVALGISIVSAIAAVASARANWRNTGREEAKEAARRQIGAELHVAFVDPEDVLRLKVFLTSAPDGFVTDITKAEVVGEPGAIYVLPGRSDPFVISLKAGDTRFEREQVNVALLNQSKLRKPIVLRFSGKRRDDRMSPMSAQVTVPLDTPRAG